MISIREENLMLSTKEISNVDKFIDQIVFDVIVECNYKGLIDKAKKIDKDNYNENCFVVRAAFDEEGLHVLNEDGDSELYYTDNDGDYVSLRYMLKEKERKDILRICANNILEMLEVK